MQEKLKIFSASGEVVLEADLAGVEKPLMILSGERPGLVETVPQGAEVIGALVRDEDGWTLASARQDMPVSSGPKTGADFHLTAGVPCALGPWAFRIEREGVATGTVLLWRVGSSAVAADPLVPGRNVVAAGLGGAYSVNPAVGGEELCSIFPTADGVDVSSADNSAQRLSVPFAALFSVGAFQGMALAAEDAAKAVASGSPFSWPSRGTRTGLMAAMLVAGLAALAALAMVKKTKSVDEQVAARHGPELIERELAGDDAKDTDEDALVFENSFYRSLPLILKPDRSSITLDLLRRGREIVGNVGGVKAEDNRTLIKGMIRFLEEVDSIQAAAHKGDWAQLKDTLASADRTMFTRCDADRFYDDAQKIADFVTDALPKFFFAVANKDACTLQNEGERLNAFFEALKGNMFMAGEIVRRERDSAQVRWDALSAYIKARKDFMESPDGTCGELRDAWADLVDAFESEEGTFSAMLARERSELAEAILAHSRDAKAATLVNLCSLGEAVGVENARLAEWRARAIEIRRELLAKYREKYSEYRLRSTVSPGDPETLAILDDMIAIGLDENQFHKWALREKERVTGRKGDDGK